MNYNLYEIKGVYSSTRRRRIKLFEAKSEEEAKAAALKEGYLDPFEVFLIPHPEPTERQLSYAHSLGLLIPQGSCQQDVSALLSRKETHDTDPNPELMEFAENRGMKFSKYIGKKSLYRLIFVELDYHDKIAFFAFSLYRYLSYDRHANLDTSPHKDTFYSFAETMLGNEAFMKSLLKHKGDELRVFGKMIVHEEGRKFEVYGASTNTIAYKVTSSFLASHFNLQKTKVQSKGQKKDINLELPGRPKLQRLGLMEEVLRSILLFIQRTILRRK